MTVLDGRPAAGSSRVLRLDDRPAWALFSDEPPPGWTEAPAPQEADLVTDAAPLAGDSALLSDGARALVAAVALLARQVPADLAGAAAVAETSVLLAQLEALHAVVLSRVADVDARQLHALDDAPSTATWVARQQTSVDRGEIALARRLSTFPLVAEALRERELSVEAGRRVSAALATLRRSVDRPDGLIDGQPAAATLEAVVVDGVLSLVAEARGGLGDDDPLLCRLADRLAAVAAAPRSELSRLEEAFVLLARHVEPVLLPSCLSRLVDALLPLAAERRAATAHDERGVVLRRTADGSGWLVSGDLDLECGELLSTVLAAELALDGDNPADTASWSAARHDGWRPGDDVPLDGPRSLRQRRHDALRNGLRRYLDAGIAGLRDKVAPHLSVTVGLGALHAEAGSLPAVAASGARLPLSLVRSWWCGSAVTRFVLSLGRKVIETSHTARTLKAHERRAKHLETGGICQGAGCRCGPGSVLVPHHGDPWSRCGTTSLDDTVLLCVQTHHELHSGGRTIRLKDGRRLGPDGWVPGGSRAPG